MTNYIFFDFDGVLNTFKKHLIEISPPSEEETLALKKFPLIPFTSGKYLSHNPKKVIRAFRAFDTDLIANANYLLDNINYTPIVSSAWRNTFNTNAINHILKFVGFKHTFLDSIPRYDQVAIEPRGYLIEEFLTKNRSTKRTHHIVIDDLNIEHINGFNVDVYKTNSYIGLTKEIVTSILARATRADSTCTLA